MVSSFSILCVKLAMYPAQVSVLKPTSVQVTPKVSMFFSPLLYAEYRDLHLYCIFLAIGCVHENAIDHMCS